MNWTETIAKEYLALWQTVSIRSEKLSAVKNMAERVLSKKTRYEAVANEFGCPWWWVGLVHAMESGCDFSTWLANGDFLSSPTTHVPRGLQCDGTWEDGARVSLKHHGMPTEDAWSLARCFYEWEKYNGFGYRSHGDVSDYLWSFTSHERAGRYVADGRWYSTAWSDQPSCGAMLKYLVQIGAVDLSSAQAPVDERVTWLEYHRLDEGGVITTGVVAYAGADPLATWTGTSKAARDDFEKRFKNVANCPLVAPPTKPWPTIRPPQPVGFVRSKLAGIAEAECNQDISWRGNGKAKKYTKKFEGVFGTGRFSWCAAFVTWCCEQAGATIPVQTPGTEWTWALCEAWQQWAKARGFWTDGIDGIARGDIVLFDWDGAAYPDTDWEDHIGIACGPASGGSVVCAEGNTDDRTAIKTRQKSLIQGYIRLPDGFKV